MKKERKELERFLNQVIDEHRIDRVLIDKVKEKLFDKNIYFGMKILTKQVPLQTQPTVILYYVARYLYHELNIETINPTNYFTELEIDEFKNFRMERETDTNEITFENFLQGSEDKWTGYLTLQEIARLYRQGIATYNIETQRNTILTKFNGKIIEDIHLNENSVKDISKLLVKGSYEPVSPIIFNILKDHTEEFHYSEKERTLTFVKGDFNIIDGFHRSMAILQALLENPNLYMNFPVTVTNLTAERARLLIAQEQHQNKMNKEYVKSLEDNLENYIIKTLNEKGELKGKISADGNAVRFNKAYVTHNILSEAILTNFEYKNRREAGQIADWLSEGFDEIIGIYYNQFNDLENAKKHSVAVKNEMFIGYVALLNRLYDNPNWKRELETILNSIDTNVNNHIWNELGITTESKLTKSRVKRISKYFMELVGSE